jgi:hypothetical protein
MFYWRGVQHPSVTGLVIVQHHPHTHLRDEIIATQKNDAGMGHNKRRMGEGDPKVACFREDAEGTLWFRERLVVPKKEALKKKIVDEAHTSRYSIHPGSTKLYHDLGHQFWWT